MLGCTGGEFGGWSMFLQDGRLHYVHNYLKLQEFDVASADKAPSGAHRFKVHYKNKDKSLKPDFFTGDVTLFIDDEKVGELADIKMAGQYSAVTGYGLQIGRNTWHARQRRRYEPPECVHRRNRQSRDRGRPHRRGRRDRAAEERHAPRGLSRGTTRRDALRDNCFTNRG